MSNPTDPTLPSEPPSFPPGPPPVPPGYGTTPPAASPPAPPYGATAPPEPPFVPPPPSKKPTGLIVGLALAVGVLAAVAFFVGRSTVKAGPKTLIAAFQQAQAGKFPCGSAPAPTGAAGGAGGFGGGGFITRVCNNGGAAGANGGAAGGAAGGAGNGGAGRFGGGAAGGAGLLGGPGATTGTVVSLTGDQLVIQTRAGNLTITLPAGVAVTKTTAGAIGDIANGSVVVVTSTTDSTGKRTASKIFILPPGTTAPQGGPPATANG